MERRWSSAHRSHFEIHPRGLTLLVPAGNVEAAARRQARDVAIRDLLALAAGAEPRERP